MRRAGGGSIGMAALRARILAKWVQRRAEWPGLAVRVDGAKLAEEVLADLAALAEVEIGELLTLRAAADECGYDEDSLGRMIRRGRLISYGEKGRPLVRRGDLPRKPGYLPRAPGGDTFARTRIARSIVNPDQGGDDAA